MYQLKDNIIIRLSDNAFIPKAEGNSDYQEYKKWIDEGNEPEIWQPPRPTLEQIKTIKIAELKNYCDQLTSPLLEEFPEIEQKTWDRQWPQSEEWLAWEASDQSAPEPEARTCRTMALNRGISLKEFCEKVIPKALYFDYASGVIVGQRQKMTDQIDAILADESMTESEKYAAVEAIDKKEIFLPSPEQSQQS